MNEALKTLLSSIQMAEAQTYRNITVFPLICPSGSDGAPEYQTLSEALHAQSLSVTEVSQAGSVPSLRVVNRGRVPVLLIDGEELIGAKQNRVLNTSVLLKEHSETIIPVSCTEQGRWAYASAAFADSGVVMAYLSRALKSSSVSESLARGMQYASDQGVVWDHIQALHAKAGTSSPTGAMREVYAARRADLDNGSKAFAPVPNQTGLLVLINGAVAGFDFVSRSAAYGQLHSKLLKSYLIEALVEPSSEILEPAQAQERARAFLAEAQETEARQFASVGQGFDVRFKGPGLRGTALVHEGHVVHTAFFRLPPEEERDRMAPLRSRWQFGVG
jgi:hypothetical protein